MSAKTNDSSSLMHFPLRRLQACRSTSPSQTSGMPADESISDDVIADLLKKDARESSIKFSALGLQAFLPKRYDLICL